MSRTQQTCVNALGAKGTGTTPATIEACVAAYPSYACTAWLEDNPARRLRSAEGDTRHRSRLRGERAVREHVLRGRRLRRMWHVPAAARGRRDLPGQRRLRPRPVVRQGRRVHHDDHGHLYALRRVGRGVPHRDLDLRSGPGLRRGRPDDQDHGRVRHAGRDGERGLRRLAKDGRKLQRQSGLVCIPSAKGSGAGTCQTITLAMPGEPCGDVGSNPITAYAECQTGFCQKASTTATNGTCVANIADEAACSTIDDASVQRPCEVRPRLGGLDDRHLQAPDASTCMSSGPGDGEGPGGPSASSPCAAVRASPQEITRKGAIFQSVRAGTGGAFGPGHAARARSLPGGVHVRGRLALLACGSGDSSSGDTSPDGGGTSSGSGSGSGGEHSDSGGGSGGGSGSSGGSGSGGGSGERRRGPALHRQRERRARPLDRLRWAPERRRPQRVRGLRQSRPRHVQPPARASAIASSTRHLQPSTSVHAGVRNVNFPSSSCRPASSRSPAPDTPPTPSG